MASFSIAERVKRLVRLARTSLPANETATRQQQQVEYLGKVADAVAHYPYGFHAVAPADTLALLFSQMGNPEALIHLPGFDTNRPTTLGLPMVEGEVAIYHPASGAKVHFHADGSIEVVAITAVNFTAPAVTMSGTLTVTGAIVGGTVATALGRDLDTHTHVGSPTAPTGAISNTGAPV